MKLSMEMKTKEYDLKHIIIISISIIALIISFFNASFAYFADSKNNPITLKSTSSFGESTVHDTNVFLEGNLSYTNKLKNNSTLSFVKDNVDDYDYLLSVATQVDPHITEYESNEYTNISYEIFHKTEETLDTTIFTCNNNLYNNGTTEDYCNKGTFIENSLNGLPFELIKDFRITDTNTHYFDVYIYLNNETESKVFKTRIFYVEKEIEKGKKEKTLEEVKRFISNNEPDLNTGLIPVVYDDKKGTDTHWFVADTSKAWYDYESQWWANAVSVDSSTTEKRAKYVNSDGTYKTGIEIATSDMLAMFVWIPRYSYTIGCTSTDSCLGYKVEGASDLATNTPGAIDIKFVAKNTKDELKYEDEKKIKLIYPKYEYSVDSSGMPTNDRDPQNWYTHPAFDFGGEPLSGIWVGKFETSVNPNSACYTALINKNSTDAKNNCVSTEEDVTPRILPNVLSLVRQSVSNQYETAKKFLGNEMYGIKDIVDSHMMKNIEWAAVAYLSQSIYGKYGNTNYIEANKEIYKNDSGRYVSSSYAYWGGYTGRSQGFAPTTGSYIEYGTYKYNDVEVNVDGTDGEKVINGGTGASTTGNIYGIYDMSGGTYEYVMGNYNDITKNSGFDESWFTTTSNSKYYDKYDSININTSMSNKFTGHALFETVGWYSDSKAAFSDSNTWILRGGQYNTTSAGIFLLYASTGDVNNARTFRSVLVSTK